MINQILLAELKKLLEHLEYYNSLAPFPVYDTGYVQDIRDKIKEMENTKKDYDNEPVTACKYCKSLHIVVDDDDNNICHRCGSVNEIKEYKNIYEYKKFVDGCENA